MKTFLFLACAFLLLLAGGCTSTLRDAGILPQKAATDHPAYRPYYEQPAPRAPTAPKAPPAASAVLYKQKAAILLPLSGSNAALGQSMLNAAQQAVFDSAGTNFELQPRDTAAAGGAEAAARKAVAEGASLIIGPLFAADIPPVKRVAQANNLMVLPLSTDASLAERGVFVMGLAPAAQVQRIISYAYQRGAHRFAALVPLTPYGTLVDDVFRRALAEQGQTLIDVQIYDPKGNDLPERVQALARQQDMIDALFLPEGGSDLKKVADQLAAAGFNASRTRLIGTGLWDTPALGHQIPFIVGGWYAAPDPAQRRTFIASYQAVYGAEPPRLATLAYDATALAAILAKRGIRFDETALTNPNGFAGLDGIFRLRPSGAVERATAVLEVTRTGALVIDASPTSFMHSTR